MSKSTQTQPARKTWSKPRLNRLGTIADVAFNLGEGPQGTGSRT